MQKLSMKLKMIIRTAKQSLCKKDVVILVKDLINHYDLEPEELFGRSEKTSVQSQNGQESSPVKTYGSFEVIPGVGVVLPSRKVLYLDGSENKGYLSNAHSYMVKLPAGYSWHVMTDSELKEIMSLKPEIDDVLRRIGGLPMRYPEQEYLLSGQGKMGYVRYLAPL